MNTTASFALAGGIRKPLAELMTAPRRLIVQRFPPAGSAGFVDVQNLGATRADGKRSDQGENTKLLHDTTRQLSNALHSSL
ncbi:hypothetical protein, partial [Francisella tularensis]|uniref:hypothetical protein n=1 Tax=Francisella tularensis TaxID=263 RepID=UPI001F3321E9